MKKVNQKMQKLYNRLHATMNFHREFQFVSQHVADTFQQQIGDFQ